MQMIKILSAGNAYYRQSIDFPFMFRKGKGKKREFSKLTYMYNKSTPRDSQPRQIAHYDSCY